MDSTPLRVEELNSEKEEMEFHKQKNVSMTYIGETEQESMWMDSTIADFSVIPMSSTRKVQEHLTKDIVRAFMQDYYEDYNDCIKFGHSRACWEAFFEKRYHPGYTLVRSSGNPVDTEGILKMFMTKRLQLLAMTLISVESVKILAGGLAAVVVYTADQTFLFQGCINLDRSSFTAVIEEVNGEPLIVQEQRSTGVPFPTRETRWSRGGSADLSNKNRSADAQRRGLRKTNSPRFPRKRISREGLSEATTATTERRTR